ncbi:seminase [Scaptodrosophila lebanonensis]|uniref:trypsin n=1 Tax=Drosophila lebanonensis TaxID=7225 RepID=A0A6J2TH76_DROLE|nr:seminase [Scaptodrosophila lebanonensis]
MYPRLRVLGPTPVLFLLWLLDSSGICTSQSIEPRIVGGTTTTQSQIGGYVVNIRYNGQFICGGTLVSNLFVITAAHCIYGYQANSMTVQGGVTRLTQRGVIRRVYKAMRPSIYNPELLNMDVGVIKLRSAMVGRNISPISLCSVQWRAGSYMRVSGWGATLPNVSDTSIQLRTVRLRLMNKTVCKSMYRGVTELYASMFCARASGKDTCTGDSGGGVIYNNQLCGIVSWGLQCADPRYPGVYTSIHRARSFINGAMQK